MADIFRLHGPAYLEKYGERMPQRHRTVMEKIIACRTEELAPPRYHTKLWKRSGGGEVFLCKPCQEYRYSYHSCQNRHCPKCGNEKADEWLKMQTALLLSVKYFMVTVTLPDTLHAVARRHQKLLYGLFFQTAAAALQKLARDPKFVGGQVGFFGVLQTWARDLAYHPHLHFIIAGGGLSQDGNVWRQAHGKFLAPVPALSKIFRAKFRDALKKKPELFSQVPPETWQKEWVVHCQPVGSGERAIKYLAPYIFRVAISPATAGLKLENGNVTFQYRDGETKQFKTRTFSAEEFIRRFLQHVLPKGFIKVRYYGFLSARHRPRLERVKELLNVQPVAMKPTDVAGTDASVDSETHPMRCPKCGGVMQWVGDIAPTRTRAP